LPRSRTSISWRIGSGTLIEFDFTALAHGTSTLTIGNEILQDSTGAILTDATTLGAVTVAAVPEAPALFLVATRLFFFLMAIDPRRAHAPEIAHVEEAHTAYQWKLREAGART
jgi:hypothetical protein